MLNRRDRNLAGYAQIKAICNALSWLYLAHARLPTKIENPSFSTIKRHSLQCTEYTS